MGLKRPNHTLSKMKWEGKEITNRVKYEYHALPYKGRHLPEPMRGGGESKYTVQSCRERRREESSCLGDYKN